LLLEQQQWREAAAAVEVVGGIVVALRKLHNPHLHAWMEGEQVEYTHSKLQRRR
jgi:predicted nucleotide-binding protein (sugar kinase/HSP70/actin superfamily)